MTPSPERAAIAVATSIPPRLVRRDAGRSIGEEYQKLCIRSWMDSGFRILSVNDREEIPDLAARYPEVDFVATDRNASAWSGRKNPYIADLLLALKDAPEPILGIINSDLIFEPSSEWGTRLPSLVGDAIIVGNRYDADSLLRGAFQRYSGGIDCFFFDKTLAREALEHAMPFAIGLSWWDYWLPLVAAFNNRQILVADRPSVVHLVHRQGNTAAVWREFAHIFANFVMRQFESASHASPEIVKTIVPACREIAALQRKDLIGSRKYDGKISNLMNVFAQQIRKNVLCLESSKLPASGTYSSNGADPIEPFPGLETALTVDNVFRRFDRRRAAGEALLRAKRLMGKDRLAEAEPELRAAIHETPEDFDVLLTFGEFALRRGELENAHLVLSKAAEQKSNSTRRLQLLGAVLHAMGRRGEAIECFLKILHADPGFQAAYTDVAIVLWEMNRQHEAIAHLERAMEQWPDFAGAAELYDRFRKESGGHPALPARARQRKKQAAYSSMLRPFHRLIGAISRTVSRAIRLWRPSGPRDDKRSG
jgi:tetratricopeptide (TPR) repeat protein